ncbi:DUF7310 family coiled-coil domain-containing protein [Salinibaculum salinum]|uniref:DUF7310 family coiled-coil domain-containing protein n=1 Tax=Salinibaculum salinum TaxID=3131996 RepID=UPI0030EC4977
MDETLEDRLAALERALTDDTHDLGALAADGEVATRVQTVESDIEELTERIDELEAATQALRGYVGNVRAVNEEVRERADLALETAERAVAESTERGPSESESTDSDPVGAREGYDRPAKDQPTDGSSPETLEEEPTLELTSNRDSRTETHRSQSPDERCPLCDGKTGRSRQGRDSRQERDVTQPDSDPTDPLQGLTDGGRMQATESSPTPDNSGLLTRIRALL